MQILSGKNKTKKNQTSRIWLRPEDKLGIFTFSDFNRTTCDNRYLDFLLLGKETERE